MSVICRVCAHGSPTNCRHSLHSTPPARESPRVGAHFFFKGNILISLRCFHAVAVSVKKKFGVSDTDLQFPGPPTPSLPPSFPPSAHLAATDPLPGHSSRGPPRLQRWRIDTSYCLAVKHRSAIAEAMPLKYS